MTAYILKGDPKEVDKVLRENRIRVQRGVIEFTPVEPDAALDEAGDENFSEGVHDPSESIGKESETDGTVDDKHIEVDDRQDVNHDTDKKDTISDDTKDVSGDDAKEVPNTIKTPKRSKKAE